MIFKKPLFWDISKPNLISYILIPFTLPIILRNYILLFLKKKKSSKIKTICVGNIYLGGTGKTPLSIKLYEILNNLGYKASIVKKKYSSQIDEHLLLVKKSPLIITRYRKNAIEVGIEREDDFLIFDDGLQDAEIEYNIQFVCFKLKPWIGNGQLIPAGPMREKISSLKKYDAVFLNGHSGNFDEIKSKIYSINPNIKIFKTSYKISNLEKFDLNLKYLIFSGIGNPEDFKELLIKNNFVVKKEIIFPDHYKFKINDFIKIINTANNEGLEILTTEKDYMKIPDKFRKKINFINLNLIIEKESQLIELLKK